MTLTKFAGHLFFGVLVILLNLNFTSFALGQDLPYSKYQKGFSDLNFGLVKDNSTYKIYRSSYLSRSRLEKLASHLDKSDLEFPQTIIYMNKNGYGGWASIWEEHAIQEYLESSNYGYTFFHSFGYDYRTYVDGENPYSPKGDIDKGRNVNSVAKKLFHYREDNKKDGGVDAFLRVMAVVLDPTRQPVLFHCKGGRHRTGMVGLMLRYIEGGDWVDGAKKLAKISGKKIMINPAEYEYLLHAGSKARLNNVLFIRKFVKEEPIFQDWVERYRDYLRE